MKKKHCHICRRLLDASEFAKSPRAFDRLAAACSECIKEKTMTKAEIDKIDPYDFSDLERAGCI